MFHTKIKILKIAMTVGMITMLYDKIHYWRHKKPLGLQVILLTWKAPSIINWT